MALSSISVPGSHDEVERIWLKVDICLLFLKLLSKLQKEIIFFSDLMHLQISYVVLTWFFFFYS